MLNKFALIILCFFLGSVVMADTVAVNPDHPGSYVVKKGDTLWGISGQFLQEPWRWPDIWQANPQIEDPHLIYPGDVVSLVYQDGVPILTVSRSGIQRTTSGRNVKLSPTVRSYERDDAIPAIPVDAIKQFLTRPLVVEEEEMDTWPYIVSSYEEHLIAGEGNKIYVRGLDEDATTKRYSIYRKGPALRRGIDPFGSYSSDTTRFERTEEREILGYEALYVGDAVIEKLGDPASAIVATSAREILVGDRLAAETEADINTNFIPHAPSQDVKGSIISAIEVVSEIGQYQVVVFDIGENDGLEVGNVLGIYQSGIIVKDYIASDRNTIVDAPVECDYDEGPGCAVVRDFVRAGRAYSRTGLGQYLGPLHAKAEEVELPEEFAGVLLVFRTFENVSYALIMEAVSPIHLYDTVQNL